MHYVVTCIHKIRHLLACIGSRTRGSAIAEGPRDALSQLRCCRLLHNCTKNLMWKDLKWTNNFECHSTSSEVALFDKRYATSYQWCQWSVVITSIFCTVSEILSLSQPCCSMIWPSNLTGMQVRSRPWGFRGPELLTTTRVTCEIF